MKVLLYGNGAREHAICEKLKASPLLTKLYLCNPNDGFKAVGEVISAKTYEELAKKAHIQDINLLIVGPEVPLTEGIVDEFKKFNIPAIGADKKWAMLEGSKEFAKIFMKKNAIATAQYQVINSKNEIEKAIRHFNFPIVIKANGLAAGKGVFITENKEESIKTINEFLDGKFSESSKTVIIEEFLQGEEVSLISFWDGKTLLPLIPAKDYKKLLNENKGPNTGGMGSYCPVDLTCEQENQLKEYSLKLEKALKKENADFIGIVYSGLILTKQGVKVLEYNMRFGDPETQALLLHLNSDLLEIFNLMINQKLDETKISWKQDKSYCVVIAAKGYPETPQNGCEIKNIDYINQKFGINTYFAGVTKANNSLTANGGRVLSLCKTGKSALNDIYKAANELDFKDKYFRSDIGL